MGKVRIYEIAREVGIDSKVLVEKLQDMGFDVKSHASALEDFEARTVVERLKAERQAKLTEKRIGARVIRRRPRADEAAGPAELTEAIAEEGAPELERSPEAEELAPHELTGEVEALPEEDRGIQTEAEAQAQAEVEGDELPPPPAVDEPSAPPPADATGQVAQAAPVVAQPAPAEAVRPPSKPTPTHPLGGSEINQRLRRRRESAEEFVQARVIRRPSPEAALPPPRPAEAPPKPSTGIRVLKVVPGKEGRGNQFIDVSPKGEIKRKKVVSTRLQKNDIRDAIFDAFTPGFTPGMSRRRRMARGKGGRKTLVTTPSAIKRTIKMESNQIAVSDLSKRMGVKLRDVNLKLRELGEEIDNLNDDRVIDIEIAKLVAQSFDHEIVDISFKESDLLEGEQGEEGAEELDPRPPVVTIMGHVDHGKTSVLDAVRKTHVAAGEAGGITQHIGAYEVHLPSGSISFIDTPGHEAFTAMRARGASVTDIVVLVVAADDGIMPQTVEAINHAKDAGVPIMVAINKIDLPNANAERVRNDLTKYALVPEAWGGDTIVTEVSAKTKVGLDLLLENILLQAEMLNLRANSKRPATGVVLEARLDRGRGPIATLLVQQGTLEKGDIVIVGTATGRIRMMYNHEGKAQHAVAPGRPVQVQGLDEVPMAGESFNIVKSEREAKRIIEHRREEQKAARQGQSARLSLEDFYEQLQGKEKLELKVLVKADVQGSAEAVKQAIEKLSTAKVGVKVVHYGVGAIAETDVNLASASGAILVGFNIRPDPNAKKLAQKLGIEIRLYEIIYDLTEDIRKAQVGLLPSTRKENVIGTAEVRDLFVVPKIGTVAGVMVTDGKMVRNAKIRLLRDSVEVYNGKLSSLRRFKDDAREVDKGFECGIGLENFNDIKRGDILEAYVVEEERQSVI